MARCRFIQVSFTITVLLVASLAPTTSSPVVASRHAARSHGKVLYHANWSKGLSGWDIQPGCTVANGMLSYDGRASGDATAPFRTKRLKNFAVVATIQVESFTKPTLHSFGPFVRYTLKNRDAGIYPGPNFLYGTTDVATLFWRGNNENLAISDPFQPGTDFHVYRAEVRGNRYRLLIDGHATVPWTIIKEYRALSGVGVTGFYAKINVKDFTVLALGSAHVRDAKDTRPLEARALTAQDVGMTGGSGSFRDNAVYARENNVALATLDAAGRLYGYTEQYSNGATTVVEDIEQYRSPEGAKSGFDAYVKRDRDRGYAELTPPPSTVGEESAAFAIPGAQGQTRHGFIVEFHRGAYNVRLTVTSTDPATVQNATTIAQKADQILQSAT